MKRLQELFEGSSAIAEDNLAFLEDLYERYLRDPDSVDSSWREKFRSIQEEPLVLQLDRKIRTTRPSTEREEIETTLRKQAAVDQLIYHHRTRGHQVANNNPLKISETPRLRDLDPASYGLTETDLDSHFYVDILHHLRRLALREILSLLRQTYCESIGAEYMHIVDSDIKLWIQSRLENTRGRAFPDPESQRNLLRALTAAEGIERYLHRKYVGQ